MATNQYLPFATGGGANVLAPADYQALPARTPGFTAGTASSEFCNTVWRQSSIAAAMLGQFVGDIGGFDALDDGIVANLLTSFERTIQAQSMNYAVDTGTADALVVTLNPVPASLTLGMKVRLQKGANGNATTAPTLNVGTGAKVIKTRLGGAVAVNDCPAGAYMEFEWDGTYWRVVGPVASEFSAGVINNPIFPEISGPGNVFNFATSTGQIIINTGLSWQYRGLLFYSTTSFTAPARTFVTAASKTYHLVWDAPGTGLATPAATYPSGLFSLIDRTGASPPETDPQYDTTYDRMLIARVVTNGANALTVTALANKAALTGSAIVTTTPTFTTGNAYTATYSPTFNWARTPNFTFNATVYATTVGTGGLEGGANYSTSYTLTRYGANLNVFTDWTAAATPSGLVSQLNYSAVA